MTSNGIVETFLDRQLINDDEENRRREEDEPSKRQPKYLGMPLGPTLKQTSVWDSIIDKFQKKLAKWRRRFLSKAQRIILINSALASLPVYFMSLLQIPAVVEKKMVKIMREFLWGSTSERKKINWVAWGKMNKPKKLGGLGIRNLRATNRALLSKWSWRYAKEKEALWRRVVQLKTKSDAEDLCSMEYKLPHGRGLWRGIQQRGNLLHTNSQFSVGNENTVKFWIDPWSAQPPLYQTFNLAYKAAANKKAKIAELIQNGRWCIQLKATSSSEAHLQLANLIAAIGSPPTLTDANDKISFQNGNYTAKEGYQMIMKQMNPNIPHDFGYIWRKKVPPKAQVFAWLAVQNAIPTIGNLNQRGCDISNTICCLCNNEVESVDHILLLCPFSESIWNYFMTRMNQQYTPSTTIQGLFQNWQCRNGRKIGRKVWTFLPFVVAWSIWSERNRRVMAKKRGRDKDEVIIEIKRRIFQWAEPYNWFKFHSFRDLISQWETVMDCNPESV